MVGRLQSSLFGENAYTAAALATTADGYAQVAGDDAATAPESVYALTSHEEESIKKRLSNLGYL
jgi:hypothetical protein